MHGVARCEVACLDFLKDRKPIGYCVVQVLHNRSSTLAWYEKIYARVTDEDKSIV